MYVNKDANGNITGCFTASQYAGQLQLADNDPAVVAYLNTALLMPNVQGFIQAIKTALGGIVASNALAVKYPLFFAAVSQTAWPDVQALIIDANTTAAITPTQYAAIKSAAAANNIPVTLP